MTSHPNPIDDIWAMGMEVPNVQPEWSLALLEPPICFYRQFVPLAGSVNGALFLSALVDALAMAHGQPPSTLVYDHAEITRRVGLSEKEQRTARKALTDAGLISEKRFGMPPRTLTKVNVQAIMQRIREASEDKHASAKQTLGLAAS
jgi:hypothetical protein